LSLAWAVAHHLAAEVRSFTLFATHYFELTALAQQLEGCVNVHLDATEHGESLVFLHAVKPGPASRSYGLAVAQLAGVPRTVVARARAFLHELEAQRAASGPSGPQGELPLFNAAATVHDSLRQRLAELRPEECSPRQALELLFDLQELAGRD
ncbi:MAG TPA: hypothetical protein VF848_06410, partial [Steroidobacteraceae bacterium]